MKLTNFNSNLKPLRSLTFIVVIISLSACASQGVYETVQGYERSTASCGHREIDDSVCNKEGLSYEEYQRERQALLNGSKTGE